MAVTPAERKRAQRERDKQHLKRLDLMIDPQSKEIFTFRAKDKGLTQVEYFSYLLALDNA